VGRSRATSASSATTPPGVVNIDRPRGRPGDASASCGSFDTASTAPR
jgi:hypothetical protein